MEFFQEFRHSDSLIFVDPAMADGGRLYAGFGPEFPQAMARVCAQADIIVPNLTEALSLIHIFCGSTRTASNVFP